MECMYFTWKKDEIFLGGWLGDECLSLKPISYVEILISHVRAAGDGLWKGYEEWKN